MIEKIVCSLELAKKLKELGVKQESYFVWFQLKENITWDLYESWQVKNDDRFHTISAFTAQELLNLLNATLRISKNYYESILQIYYQPEYGTDNSYTFDGDNLSNLLARVLIAQIQEGEYEFK